MAVKRLLDGRFQLIRVISSKSHSKTYLMADYSDPAKSKCIAKHIQLPSRNPVTLKFLNELLARRAKILQRLSDHPALANNLACIQDGPDFYWVRTYIPGRPLQTELALNKPSSEPEVRSLLTEILSCLEVLQHHGIVHQNLHPNNLIRHLDDDHLVVVDYSLAQENHQHKIALNGNGNGTRTSQEVSGSALYLPRVSHPQYPHFNADHFALGMIGLKAATGLSSEALPEFYQTDFLAQFRLQLDECSTLGESTKQILVGMVSTRAEPSFSQAKTILGQLNAAPIRFPANPPIPAQNGRVNTPRKTAMETPPEPQATKPKSPQRKWWLLLAALPVVLVAAAVGLRLPERVLVANLMRQAQAAQEQGQPQEALDHLNQIVEYQPDNDEVLAQRSSLLWGSGKSDQALQDITLALQVQPDNPQWYFQRGNIRFHMGDLQGAITDYTEALHLDENFSDAYVNRGSARAERGDEEGAVQDYSSALDLASDPQLKSSAYLNRCLSLSNLEEDARAIADCTEAINLQPNNSLAYENRGLVKRRLGDAQGALQDYTIAIQIDPSSPEPYYNRALTRQELGDLSGAMEDFNRTIALDSEHPFAYYDRGLLHAELGQREQAIADFEQVATVCLEVGRVGCFEDAQYQLNELGVETP
jgi:tetratricopeptide (TPR) repeat protein